MASYAAAILTLRSSLAVPRSSILAGFAVATCVALGGCGGSAPASSSHASASHGSAHRHATPGHRATPLPATLSYRHLYDLPAPVQDPASTALGQSGFVLLGGLTPADTSTDAVIVGDLHAAAQKAALPNAQHDAQAATLGGKVYLFGGGQFSEYDHILVFDPATDAVATAGTLPTAASDVAVTGAGSTGYVIGGFDGVNWLNTVLSYAPGGAPKLLAHLPVALRYAAAAVVGGAIVIAGGSTPSGISNAIYRVNSTTGAVTTLGHLPKALTHAAAGVIGNTVYLVGGRGDLVSDRSAAIWAIDPASGQVRAAGSLPAPTSDLAVVSLGAGLIVAGGATSAGTQAAVGELTAAG